MFVSLRYAATHEPDTERHIYLLIAGLLLMPGTLSISDTCSSSCCRRMTYRWCTYVGAGNGSFVDLPYPTDRYFKSGLELETHAQDSSFNSAPTVVANSTNIGLSLPGAIAVDWRGNLFIADTVDNRVVEEPWDAKNAAYGGF